MRDREKRVRKHRGKMRPTNMHLYALVTSNYALRLTNYTNYAAALRLINNYGLVTTLRLSNYAGNVGAFF